MPTDAVITMLKWMGSMPIFSAIGNTTGISTTAAGRPSSTMPNIMVIKAVHHQEQPGRGLERPQHVGQQRRHARHAHQVLEHRGDGEQEDHRGGQHGAVVGELAHLAKLTLR